MQKRSAFVVINYAVNVFYLCVYVLFVSVLLASTPLYLHFFFHTLRGRRREYCEQNTPLHCMSQGIHLSTFE